jgi:hypothetical protein
MQSPLDHARAATLHRMAPIARGQSPARGLVDSLNNLPILALLFGPFIFDFYLMYGR